MKKRKNKITIIEINNETINVKKISSFYKGIKLILDLLLSLIAICVLSPLIFLIFIINIFVTKGHPIFFDKRVGHKGKIINVAKFRSMVYDAETNIDKYLSASQKEEWMKNRKIENDPRITKFGSMLRKTSLDELPQLFNILFCDMSLVGPRPMSSREIENEFTDEERAVILSVRPGLTGYWQISGRSNVSFNDRKRQQLELEYFGKRSLFFDFYILIKTFVAVLKRDGAE